MSKVSNFIGMSFPNEQNSIQSKDTSQNVPIRTLFVALIEEHITEDMVRKYFSIFGDVELVEIHYNRYNKFGSGFVQFKDDAVCVLNHRREHCIEGCHFSVRAADMLCQPDFQRSFGPIPEQDSASHILVALNDDCLHEVFKYLNTIELSCAAEVCVRFNQEAKITFARKYRNLDITYGSSLTKRTAECLFHNFGSLIHSLSVNARLLESQSDFLALVSVQCTRLKELRLTYFNIDFVEQSDLRNKVRPLFRLLQKLHLTNYPNLEDMQKFLTTCNELKVLRIEYCHIAWWRLVV
ncbi:uncharacterized protein LOC129575964 isoform X2 [Sitodiplosis mosellana]|uniref:uncharacterized protein LOC129575964 isoform X2 n=1 Tax=Sitodiplosis mosellana TaxID=263140 RepID=UPI002443D3B6|nr:uncharacterized protein LOC129575964 isoform X2 [Sitodiplosis mosellana]